jgi:hypothetical protein
MATRKRRTEGKKRRHRRSDGAGATAYRSRGAREIVAFGWQPETAFKFSQALFDAKIKGLDVKTRDLAEVLPRIRALVEDVIRSEHYEVPAEVATTLLMSSACLGWSTMSLVADGDPAKRDRIRSRLLAAWHILLGDAPLALCHRVLSPDIVGALVLKQLQLASLLYRKLQEEKVRDQIAHEAQSVIASIVPRQPPLELVHDALMVFSSLGGRTKGPKAERRKMKVLAALLKASGIAIDVELETMRKGILAINRKRKNERKRIMLFDAGRARKKATR